MIAPLEHGSKILTGGCRYLLKRSQQRYPDQFWGEIVAYRVGAMLGFDTPPTYVGLHRPSGVVGALVEWFYDDTTEHFVPAGDLLQVVNPDFDRKLGKAHNLTDISMLMKALARTRLKGFDWHTWWLNTLAFDALIGNTDRHQENWGLIYSPNFETLRLAPLFDNGTSLGQDRFPHIVQDWSQDELDRYILNGRSHVTWERGDDRVCLFSLLRTALKTWQASADIADLRARLEVPPARLSACLRDLLNLAPPVPYRHLQQDRVAWIERNLLRRFEILKELLNEFN